LIENFEWEKALIQPDLRKNYGEPRFQAYSIIDNRVYCLVYTYDGLERGNNCVVTKQTTKIAPTGKLFFILFQRLHFHLSLF
jgi:hypothetical protein